MRRFERILVGLALDPETQEVTAGSAKAALQAVWLAGATRGKILVLHATERTDDSVAAVGQEERVRASLSAEARARLSQVVTDARAAGVDAELRVVAERAWLALIHATLRGEADLVMIGKRNRSPLEGRRLGFVATKLLRKCPAPVWVVEPDHDLVHRLVLAASDLSPVGDCVASIAAGIARQQGCELHLVHAYQIPIALQLEAAQLSEAEYGARVDDLRRRASEHLQASAADFGAGEAKGLKVHVGKGAPATVIREALAHLDPDLLVMGTLTRGGLAGILVGSTAERLLDRVDCSILALKPDDFVSPIELPE